MIHGVRSMEATLQLGLCYWEKCRLQPRLSRSLRKFAEQRRKPGLIGTSLARASGLHLPMVGFSRRLRFRKDSSECSRTEFPYLSSFWFMRNSSAGREEIHLSVREWETNML